MARHMIYHHEVKLGHMILGCEIPFKCYIMVSVTHHICVKYIMISGY